MKYTIILTLLLLSTNASAACRTVLADHDGNKYTPMKYIEVCDKRDYSDLFKTPDPKPLKPITQMPGLKPLGAKECEQVWVIENNRRKRVRVCK